MIDDGTYDAFVVDANPEVRRGQPVVVIDITIVTGAHKGEMITIVGPAGTGDPIDLLGTPGTLTVRDGVPSLRLDQ